MLHTVAKLGQNAIWNIQRVLRHEINANTFGTDQFYSLFYFFQQASGRIGEQ